ncbi:ABC transporter ATP-binding protein, partial [Vibrio alfacsensis]
MQQQDQSRAKSKNLGILLELVNFIRPYQAKVFAALVALIFTAGLTLSVGHGVRILIDQGFAQQSLQDLGNAIQF